MQQMINESDYRDFEGYFLEEKKTTWRYACVSEIPINTFIRKKNETQCHCGSELALLSYQYVANSKHSQKMQGRKCPVCGTNYFTEKTLSLHPEAFVVEENMDQLLEKKHEQIQVKATCKEEEKFEFLFVDMEWNQKAGTQEVIDREPIQIGLLGADGNLENTKLFSKAIRLEDVNTLTEETCKLAHTNEKAVMQANSLEDVFKRVRMSFSKFKYIVVWTKATYDLFKQSMNQAGVKMPKHRVVILQDIIGVIALAKNQNIGFETALKRAGISYETAYLHYSKHDVQYLFALYKKMYMAYFGLTKNEVGIINGNSRIIHTSTCRYVQHLEANVDISVKPLIFRGYRPCNCCGSEENWRRIYWEPALKENKDKNENKNRNKNKNRNENTGEKIEFRELPLTDTNIQRICNKFNIRCTISEDVVFLTTNCGYWRIYLDGDKVDRVFHGNYRIQKQEFKKKKKCNEGFHQQKITSTNFYEVVRYIYYHDKDLFTNRKKSRVEVLLEKIEQERKMKEEISCAVVTDC